MVAALVLTGVGAAYAWPLLGSRTTAIPGGPTDHDVATMVWNVGYVFRALTSEAGLLTTSDVLVPFGADLRLHTYGLLQGLAAAPLVPLLGVPGAFNLMLVGTLVLNGVAGYALMRKQRASHASALVAATCLMLALPLLDQLRVGRPTFASVWIVACALIVAGSLVDAPRLWKGLLLGLVLVAALLTDFQIVFFCGVWLAIYGIAHFRTRHAAALAVGALVFLVPFGVLFYPALAGAAAAGYPQPVPADMREYSFRIWDYVDPAVLPHAYGFELGLAAIVGAVLLWRSGKVWVWLVGAAGVSAAGARPVPPTHRHSAALRIPEHVATAGAVSNPVPHGHTSRARAGGGARPRAHAPRPLGCRAAWWASRPAC